MITHHKTNDELKKVCNTLIENTQMLKSTIKIIFYYFLSAPPKPLKEKGDDLTSST